MVRNKFYLLLVMLVLVLSFVSYGDLDTGILCSETGGEAPEYDCPLLSDNGDKYYCDVASGYCFLEELEVPAEPEPVVVEQTVTETLTVEQEIENLKANIDTLQNDLALTNSGVGSLDTDVAVLKSQLSKINQDVTSLNNRLRSDISSVENKQSSFSVGLAGLQNDIDSAKTTLENVEDSLNKRKAFTRFMTIMVLVLVVIGVIGAVLFYTTKKSKISPEVINYITSHIKSGNKYPQIKGALLKAGWSEEEIKKAYKQTAKHNYGKFKGPGKQQRVKSKGPSFAYDHKKMITITGVSLLLIIGFLFILRGVSTGQAVSFQKLIGGEVGGTSGKITYEVECTPPHILTPDSDACCLDTVTILANGTTLADTPNGICDNTEARQIEKTQGECIDNAQCGSGEYCVSSQCTSLFSLYEGKGDCSKLCNYYTLHISTSDGETYNLKPKKGSYTAAGGLEWKILEMPDHCKGEPAIVPVNIIKKKTGQILNEHVITLRQGQTSTVQTHPEIPGVAFTLKVDEIFELCSE